MRAKRGGASEKLAMVYGTATIGNLQAEPPGAVIGRGRMFVTDDKKFTCIDAERGIELDRKGCQREASGQYFILSYQGKEIPFIAEFDRIVSSDETSPLIWTILKVGSGKKREELPGGGLGNQVFFSYQFSSNEEEEEAVEIIREAMTAYRFFFGSGTEVHEVRIADDAWQHDKLRGGHSSAQKEE